MSRRESGQAAIESLVVVPLVALCSLGVVGAGLYGRQVLVVTHAAGRAGAAAVRGEDASAAARAALPVAMRRDVHVSSDAVRVSVSLPVGAGVLTPMLPRRVVASVAVDSGVAS